MWERLIAAVCPYLGVNIAVVFTTLVPHCACAWLFTKSTSLEHSRKQQERKALLAPTGDSANLHIANMWKAEGWDSEDKLAGYKFDIRNTFVFVSFKSVASEWSCWLELPFLITEQMQLRYGNALLIIMTWSHLEVREEQKGFPPGDADCSVVSIKRAWHFILFRCRLFVTDIFLPAIRCRIICSGASYGPWKCGCQWLAAPVGKARLAPWEYGKIKRAR